MSELEDATNTQLLLYIETAPEPQKKSAWDELVKRDKEKGSLHNLCFCDVAARAESPYRDMAWKLLRARNVKDIDLCYVIKQAEDSNPYREKSWKLLCAMDQEDGYCFRYLIDYAQSFKERALDEFLKRRYPVVELENLLEGRNGYESTFWKEKIVVLFKKPG